ncbi:hypothetical protein Btru_001380 [Bulinus truncatus]|nr:hypothetical protein Btru_001380 [Bulinus truncatus]
MALTASRITCKVCEITVVLIHDLMMKNASDEDIKSAVRKVCVTFNIETPRVCEGLVEEFAPEVLTVLASTKLSSTEYCSFVLGPEYGDPYHPSDNWSQWFSICAATTTCVPFTTLRFLHLTDIHFDAAYKEGSNAGSGVPLAEMMAAHLFDYIIWTGDLPPHNVWNQSSADQLTTLKVIVSLFLKYFPNKLVFPSLGAQKPSFMEFLSVALNKDITTAMCK